MVPHALATEVGLKRVALVRVALVGVMIVNAEIFSVMVILKVNIALSLKLILKDVLPTSPNTS
jgi:hypothetical protein